MGRPIKYDRVEITKKLEEYTATTDIPVLAEFCYKNNLIRQYLYEMAEGNKNLSDAIKNCIQKKEAQLEIMSLRGEVNSTQAIFSLKQLGWRDKQEIEHSGESGVRIINDIPKRS